MAGAGESSSDREADATPSRGVRRGRALAGLLLVLGAIGLPVTVVRALGDVGGPGATVGEATPFVQLLAFTPWFALPCLAAVVVARAARRRLATLAFAVTVLAHLLWLMPAVVEAGPGGREADLTVVVVNAYGGGVEAGELLAEVREAEADVLVVVELTDGLVQRLRDAGLETDLPHARLAPAAAASGAGIWSRYPLRGLPAVAGTSFVMPRAEVFPGASDEPGPPGSGVVVTAVHVAPPVPAFVGRWRTDLGLLEAAVGRTDGRQLVAGDFNATRDHAPFRRLVRATGRDVAADRGRGLRPTWPAGRPVVTIDHVLVSRDVRVGEVERTELAGTDHLALTVTLDLPDDAR